MENRASVHRLNEEVPKRMLSLFRRDFLNREKHPFYKHGEAALFLARRGREIVGRIMAKIPPPAKPLAHEKLAA